MSYELESQTIETPAGEYTVRWIHDESPEQPYDWGFGMAWVGGRRYHDHTTGDHADKILSEISYHRRENAYDGNIYDTEIRSSAALARYARLKYGIVGVLEIDENFRTSEPSSDRGENFFGLAWTNPEAGASDPTESTRVSAEEWQAWADGDVFGYVVESPSGEEIDSCWGYYGFDREREYTLSVAKDAIDADVAERAVQGNRAGAGITGLI